MNIESEQIWRTLCDLPSAAVVVTDDKGIIIAINRGVNVLLGYQADDMIGRPIESMMHPQARELHRSMVLDYAGRRKTWQVTESGIVGVQRSFPDLGYSGNEDSKRFKVVNKEGKEIPIALTLQEILSDEEELIGFMAIILNNTQQYQLQEMLQHQATHDSTSGLLNWQEWMRQVQDSKRHILENGQEYHAALLVLNVDYFESLIHRSKRAGDIAIRKIGSWLLSSTRQMECRAKDLILSHFIGDEFVIYAPLTSLDGANTLADRLRTGFQGLNLGTEKNRFHTSFSIGIVAFHSEISLHYAMSLALQACREAKENGKDRIRVAKNETSVHIKLDSIIRDALHNRRLRLWTQKIVPISPAAKAADRGRAHFEVLTRMTDAKGNVISPSEFIPASERLGLAYAVDLYVIEQVLEFMQRNPGLEASISMCSINLSGASVASERMYRAIEALLQRTSFNLEKLCFEVTETTAILDSDTALAFIRRIRELGCKVAIDDFGVGYSNHQSFSRIPADCIKIDGSYTRRILEDGPLRIDAHGMINSARVRGLEIIAEFAESEGIVRELERLGVDYAQGYFFGKPEPMENLLEAITNPGEIGSSS